ncbi:DUF4190 domain-containing protein [Micromonospora purpureochromogenes]|uniref:DUF4190 domain-containing protein n=1 Tax=Micromonospora purpureochromogenes TaxID=47872 RepID=A0ABX2RJQ9_9ACTN|nr:DUF4190 domain-containing protein [Micromonospora purpureochromogenes]NYF56732.1 hypothetical protein [Micromonospora purpureochromogenes]
MTYPPPSGGWHDPSADPTLPVSGQPIPAQPTGKDPYAPADPYAGAVPAQAGPVDPYAMAGYPGAAYPGYGQPVAKTNSMAIAALVLSLVGFASCITAPVGAILGHVAMKQIRQTGEGGEGMAKAAIIVGWILTGLLLLLLAFPVIMLAVMDASSNS